jgi:hypothetical protein
LGRYRESNNDAQSAADAPTVMVLGCPATKAAL